MATRIIRRIWEIEDVPTDVTAAKLSDPTGTYGVKRNDTGAVVVADGAAMTKSGTGVYEYAFTDIVGVSYTAYVEFEYAGTFTYVEHDIAARAAEAGFQCDWNSLRVEIADFLGYPRDDSKWDADEEARLAAIIKSALLQVYFPRNVRPEMAYQWSWMRPATTIETVAPYSTGTVTVVDGVVTLDEDGTFPAWAAYGELTVDGETYTVDTLDGDNQVTLDDTSVDVDAGTSYSLARTIYDLDATFGGSFDGDLTYEPGADSLYPPVEVISDSMIRRMRQNDTSTGQPRYAAVRPATFSALVGQRWEITFQPTPNDVYELHGRSTVTPTMIDATNKYPLGGVPLSEVIVASCLAIAEQRLHDAKGFRTEQFETLLAAAIADDADAHVPDTLGYNADRSDGPAYHDTGAGGELYAFDGTIYYD